MKITHDTVRVRASRTGTIYSAPGEEGHRVRDLSQDETFFAKPRREGRWAKVSTPTGKTIGYTKSKRLSTEEGVVLADHWGYVDPKRNRPYGQSRRRRQQVATAPVVVHEEVHEVETPNETTKVVSALEKLSDAVAAGPPLEEPSRSRFAFFDRFCALRERNRASARTNHDVSVSEVRYKFATSLIRTAAAVGTVGYVAFLAAGILG